MKSFSLKTTRIIVFLLLMSICIYAGEGQCPAPPPNPGGLANTPEISFDVAKEDIGKTSASADNTENLKNYMLEILDFIFIFSK